MKFDTPEGATPLDDISDLIPAGVKTYRELNTLEGKNILKAMDLHLSRRKNPKRPWLTEAYIRRLHRDMFDDVWTWAGKYRSTQKNVGVAPPAISEEVAKLVQDVDHWNTSDMPVLERAIRLHHRLAWIHPFSNGNGRHARLMADIFLYTYRHEFPEWPVLSETGDQRSDYLAALRAADRGNIGPLLQFTQSLIPKGLKVE